MWNIFFGTVLISPQPFSFLSNNKWSLFTATDMTENEPTFYLFVKNEHVHT